MLTRGGFSSGDGSGKEEKGVGFSEHINMRCGSKTLNWGRINGIVQSGHVDTG
jgi:hypothetical protein